MMICNILINDHFDKTINEIDIRVEKSIESFQNDPNRDEILKRINENRRIQIEMIEKIKLSNLNVIKLDQQKLNSKWESVLNNTKLNLDQYDQIKAYLIQVDCFIVEENLDLDTNEIKTFPLWISNWYNSQKQLKFLRYFF